MAALSKILIPGETPLLRLPSLWGLWLPVVLAALGLLDLSSSAYGLATGSGDFVRHVAHAAVGLMMAALGIFMGCGIVDWRILVTDRRLLQHSLSDCEKYEGIPLAGIDEVRPYRLGDGLFVVARDQKIVLPCKEKTASRIREAIEGAKGAAQ
jgi:hypothetical protein